MKPFFILLLAFFTLGNSNCSGVKMRPDISSVFAAEANDKTVIIEGCGNQPVVGYTYCRVREGAPVDGTVTFVAPPSKCKTEPCVTFTVYYPTGEHAKSIVVPRDQTRVAVTWRDLVKREVFVRGDRGFWPVVMTYRWIDMNEQEFEFTVEGEMRLRVIAKEYLSLHESAEDPNLVWRWSDGNSKYGFSTAGRAYAGKK